VPLQDDQREALDALDELTDQTFTSSQYAGLILRDLKTWKAEGRAVGVDAITQWAKQRELDEWQAGLLSGLALAVAHDDDPEAHPGDASTSK
jgi:hypothetical protein